MCGIAGVYFKKQVKYERLTKFRELVKIYQYKRGPDFFGEMQVTSKFFLFHNRLAIIDVNRALQPMSDNEGVIVFNGEIYNYKDLKYSDVAYKYDSDTEVLLKGLNKEHIKFLHKTISMFAFGYYNKISKKFLVARDRIGIKQVYYVNTEDVFAFASIIIPLLVFSKRELNVEALWQFYQNRAFKAPETIFKDIKLLEPGMYIEIDTRTTSILRKRWMRRDSLKNKFKNEYDILESVECLLNESIQNRLVSDVPVGAFLSGGVDSSTIVALSSKYYPEMDVFTVSFRDKQYDESQYAKKVANRYGLKYNEIKLDCNSFLNTIEDWIQVQDDIVAILQLYVYINWLTLQVNQD